MSLRILSLATALLAASSAVHAIGDFPCAGTSGSQSCAAWAVDELAQGDISADAVCQPDPIHPEISYCGYAKAECTSNSQCDYGSCGSDGRCAGYLGDACSSDNDCQAFFFCGTDGMCGGSGADCANGDPANPIPSPNEQCASQSCDATTQKCAEMPSAGVPNGFGCSIDSICASGWCSGSSICALAASPASRNRKRSMECPSHHIACSTGLGDGFECIDADTNLEQCGGCTADGTGIDCTAIFGVESVSCEAGRCLVLSCVPGLNVNAMGTECV
ncbi:hypothetical protein DMC30DRAFT_418095 [Rhodotorula diobovata]|uniref:Protein CPL1-like domain-containing protein n=1 Tax=Rhodotorula diobovata TaxID=5288 RepID=A0A5C5FU33_9BASI|nr:hypothetical protein DMC30DRAFT_418095 [Rhodotorula diobovata]